ncbi:two-component system, sporulation sensor kinase E [Bacillus fengqiuensis]|nr:two-component system, sporulation sensor kinase E [Bacillus fengqiuensis]
MTVMHERAEGKEEYSKNQELQQLEIIFNRVMESIIVFNHSFEVIKVNDAACGLLERSKEEVMSLHIKDVLIMFPYQIIEQYYESIQIKKHFYYEGEITLHSGLRKYIKFVSEKYTGETNMLICTFHDLTERKMLEEERFVSQKMFRDMYDQAIDGIVIFNKNGQIIDVNNSLCESLQYKKEQLLDMSLAQLVDPRYRYKLTTLWRSLHQAGCAKGELSLSLENGESRYFDCTTTSNIYNEYYMSIMRDSTEKRQMEQRLAKSERKFREIFENAIDAIIIWDDQWNIIDANPAASRTFELPLSHLIGCNLERFIDMGDPETIRVTNEFRVKGAIRAELPFYMPNGEIKELEFTSKKGIIEGYNLTIYRNISERKRIDQEVRESEQKFRQIFDGSLDGIVLWDGKKNILDVNAAACKIAEMTKEEICQRSLQSFVPQEYYDELYEHHMSLEIEGKADGELTYQMRDGRTKNIEFSTKKDLIPGLYMTMMRDVTEKKAMQEQIRKSDTMQVVGQLAAGIAHEIRNPMTALKGFIQLLQGNVTEDYSLYFDVMTSELRRIETIITDFLVLAKPQAVKYEERNVSQILKDTTDLLGAEAALTNIQFVTEFIDSLPSIYCEPNQLKQVFINVLKNALEVMPSGGRIFVSAFRHNDDYIVVSIQDEGDGMPEDRVKRLGEPFYTTKEKGTGLGLMVSYKIIEEHKGYIDVKSKLGEGTTFFIYLPIYS